MSLDEYKTFGLPFDLRIMKPASGLWCNLLHLHGSNIHFDLVSGSLFPEHTFHIVNWHDRETPPSLAEALNLFSGTVCGGISQRTIVFGGQAQVRDEARDAIQQTGGRRFILGTGCVVPIVAPHGNILAAVQSVERL
jgi:uroporphyrinogen decarboxylase